MNLLSPSTHLLLVLLMPLVGAGIVWLASSRGLQAVRTSAATTAVLTLVATGLLILRYLMSDEALSNQVFAMASLPWLTGGMFNIHLSIGLDGLSLWLFGLSALLSLTAIFVSWEAVTERAAGFYMLLLLLEAAMLGVFVARDIILFYVFFEFTLVPLFFLIGIWGHDERRKAALTFFIYTLAGSVVAFLGLMTIVLWNATHTGSITFDIDTLTTGLSAHPLPMDADGGYLQWLVFLALLIGFAIKVPIFPFHTWLPLAHVEAPTGGSVDLAGVLLKIGIYGFLRFSMPMLPEATAVAAPWLFALGAFGIIYGALVALVQQDLKRLIAYSSVSHMGYVVMGLFALEPVAIEGANLQLINHGLSSAGLFAMVGMLYERFHTRSIQSLGGIAKKAPWLTTLFMLFTFSSIGLPGLNGFVGEFLILTGSFQRAWTGVSPDFQQSYLFFSLMGLVGIVLGAWYMLWAVERVFFGNSRLPPSYSINEAQNSLDLRWHEIAALSPLAIFILWIGIIPAIFLAPPSQSIRVMTYASSNAFNRNMQPTKISFGTEMITEKNKVNSQIDLPEIFLTSQKQSPVKQ
ncbi:MAG: proton-translocating NADH-quinone oxidoreductase subunit M [Planctomycetaceae bacterium]|nr:proton-translocating NADH-quinone oxidoreductase subunit M [Planctomycetaceae bacterium]